MRPVRVLVLVTVAAVIVVGLTACTPPPSNVTVDFTRIIQHLDSRAVGMDETGYAAPNVLANDATEAARVKTLGLGYMRMDLKWSTAGDYSSKIVCGGGGCDSGPTGDQWVATIKQVGAVPAVIARTASPADDAAMVRHFNTGTSTPNYVRYWIIGNEPDINGYSASTYANDFNADYDAMKAVDPNIKIIGPTTAWYDRPFIQTFLSISGSRVDGLDWHGYFQQGTTAGDITKEFQWAASVGTDVADARALVQSTIPNRAAAIFYQMGEWSLDWGGSAQTRTNFNAVWAADVLGHLLKNGGVSMFYGTKGNLLEMATGTQTDGDTGQTFTEYLDERQAPYHGYGMFTGEGLFRGFGTDLVQASTSLSDVDVFASTNQKSVVVINRSTTTAQSGQFGLAGVNGGTTVAVWQKHPGIQFLAPPAHLANITVANDRTFTYNLPPLSATTFVVG